MVTKIVIIISVAIAAVAAIYFLGKAADKKDD